MEVALHRAHVIEHFLSLFPVSLPIFIPAFPLLLELVVNRLQLLLKLYLGLVQFFVQLLQLCVFDLVGSG